MARSEMAGRSACKIFLIVCWVVCIEVDAASVTNNKEKIIFILTDGLRWDRFGQDLPNFMKMEENGVKADWLNGVFMTMTIPSTFSIATDNNQDGHRCPGILISSGCVFPQLGLYPESHGAIHNLYFNTTSGEISPSFTATMNYTQWFDAGAEPIWVTTILQGGKAGTIMYTGSNVPIKGVEPTKNIPIDLSGHCFSLPMDERIDKALSWITCRDFDIVVIYFNLPDFNLHSYGTEDQRTIDTLYEVDDAIGYLFDRLEEEDMTDTVNVIIASDHGHINSEVGKYVVLYDYINDTDVDFIIADYGPCFQLNAVDGKRDENAHPALTVYKKEELPERYHYGNNERVLDIFGCVDPGWHLHKTLQGNDTFLISDHGYDNKWMVMKSSFYAQGPHFKKNYRAEPFESVDIYSMMCEILSLDPAPNNGSRERYADMFASGAANRTVPTRVPIYLLLIFVMTIFM